MQFCKGLVSEVNLILTLWNISLLNGMDFAKALDVAIFISDNI